MYKNKGSRKEFNNYRGIFRVTTIRNVLDKLIYNDESVNIDENLRDSNVGARKNRNIRNNIFVLSSITSNIKKGTLKVLMFTHMMQRSVLINCGHRSVTMTYLRMGLEMTN